MKKIIVSSWLLIIGSLLYSQQITTDNIKKHIQYLSSDELKGRGTGSSEELVAATYISKQFKKLKLEPKGDNNNYFFSYQFKKPQNSRDTVGGALVSSRNVVGYLDNKADYTVIIGGHFDHLGMGMDHNSSDEHPEGKIHNGADDNASGVAGVIELARYFSQNKKNEKFNFLFICFSGEELGLVGSKKFCENPTIDFLKVNYMINMDMIGRLSDSTNKIVVFGVGTSADWIPVLDKTNSDFKIKKDSAGMGPSDQTSFYLKNIPAVHFFTGQHIDYHKPTDKFEKINFNGEKKVLGYIVKVIEETENLPKMKFLTTRNPEPVKTARKVSLGLMPDYTFEGKGMKIDGVTKGKPGEAAGVLQGDLLIQLGEVKIEKMSDYMKELAKFNKGDTVEGTLLRAGKEVKVKFIF
ncbi:MAG: M20/M25/M40 family metallo-hydrolase [Bacteroidetes bacterium]|nr:M20/M25/M40 family metallo-hydrolase [Bacteroidota bacterium]